MKKLIIFGTAVVVSSAVVSRILMKRKRERIRAEFAQRDPEELIQMLQDAALVLELKEMMDMDDETRERFERAHDCLRSKIEY